MAFVVIGGGIAAVSCVEAMCAHRRTGSDDSTLTKIIVISASALVKAATNVEQVAQIAQRFDVEERPLTWLEYSYPNVHVVHAIAHSIDPAQKTVLCQVLDRSNTPATLTVKYDRLCICTGGKPRSLTGLRRVNDCSEYIMTVRDTDSVRSFQRRIQAGSRRAVLVGNGGIATELAYELGIELVWIVKHASISATFVDAGAGEFFLQSLRNRTSSKEQEKDDNLIFKVAKHRKYTVEDGATAENDTKMHAHALPLHGSALGPDWLQHNRLAGDSSENCRTYSRLHIEYKCEISRIISRAEMKAAQNAELYAVKPHFVLPAASAAHDPSSFEAENGDDWPVYVQLMNNRIFGCDFIINATGVEPQHPPINYAGSALGRIDVDETDGGILVNERMQSSLADIYAAGDCCTAGWQHSPHWMQMRLWTQARQMGYYAGKCMLIRVDDAEAAASSTMDFCFEIFTHVTKFFGFKVVLLGLFNNSTASAVTGANNNNVLVRIEPGEQYIKVILESKTSQDEVRQVVRGAILIGETDMEETLENLILNQINVSRYGEHLLDPNVDVEDYFD